MNRGCQPRSIPQLHDKPSLAIREEDGAPVKPVMRVASLGTLDKANLARRRAPVLLLAWN
jgi:hypothetical protein